MEKKELTLQQKFGTPEHQATAKEARAILDEMKKPSAEDKINEAWAKIQGEIKSAVLKGQDRVTVNAAGHHSPAMKKGIVAKLEKAGFEFDLLGVDLTIFW